MHTPRSHRQLSRHETRARRRRRFRRGVEVQLWRISALMLAATTLLLNAERPKPAELHVSARFMRAEQPAAEMDRAIPRNASAVLLVFDPAPMSPATAERMHGAIRRLAQRMPVAAALRGDASAETLAVASAAHRIFAEETGMILPGALAAPGRGPVRAPVALVSTRGGLDDDPEAAGQDAPGAVTTAGRAALFRAWLARRLAADRGADAAAVAALEAGHGIGGEAARRAGLVDAVGVAPDARDWIRQAAEGRVDWAPRTGARTGAHPGAPPAAAPAPCAVACPGPAGAAPAPPAPRDAFPAWATEDAPGRTRGARG